MKRRWLWLVVLAFSALLAAALCSGCNQGGESGKVPAKVTTPTTTSGGAAGSGTPPATTNPPAGQSAATTSGGVKSGEGAAAPGGEAKPPETKTPGGEATPPPAGGKSAGGGEAAPKEAEGGAAKGTAASPGVKASKSTDAAGQAEEKGEAKPDLSNDEKIANFKNMDPREIIDKKYTDLEDRKTDPWNEEKPEKFIPETGRVDPLTRVDSAVPKELAPPRAGETDQNQIDNYLIAQQASLIVAGIAASLQCHNVIQIGLDKYASFSIADNGQGGGGGMFTLQEGQSSGQFMTGMVNGIPLVGSVTCASISTKQVVLIISVAGWGTPTSISKEQVFIPRNRF